MSNAHEVQSDSERFRLAVALLIVATTFLIIAAVSTAVSIATGEDLELLINFFNVLGLAFLGSASIAYMYITNNE